MSQSFDELAEAALKQMATQTTHGRTVIRKSPSNNSQTSHQTAHQINSQLSSRSSSPASTNPFASTASSPTQSHPTNTASSHQTNNQTHQHAANQAQNHTNNPSSNQPTKPSLAHPSPDPDNLPPMPAAPAEETANMEIAELNEQKITVLLAQQKANQIAQHSLTHVLQAQFESLSQQQSKLAYIQSELRQLDQTLSENISQLRDEIEGVGREVVVLQHTFDAAQKVFLDSRLALAKKNQRKLLLTGHLNSIILSNEQAKASKLTELQIQMGLMPDPNAGDNNKQANGIVAATDPPAPSFAGFE